MNTKSTTFPAITHWQANVNGISVLVAEAGNKGNQTILFLHGFPENRQAFEGVMNELKDAYHLLAIDLPGIGGSEAIASGDKYAISESNRNYYAAAYAQPSSLKTAFDWYRAFPQDEKDNAHCSLITTPVLYLRGKNEPGDSIEQYVAGFKKNGLLSIKPILIPDCGHFSAEEQPVKVAKAIAEFVAS